MAIATRTGIVLLLLLAQGLGGLGCNDRRAGPIAPGVAGVSPETGLPIRGFVADTAGRALAGARVEAVDGPRAGTSTTANNQGEFTLTGAFDDATRFRASKEGHVAATQAVPPPCSGCAPGRFLYFSLDVLAAPVNLAGSYTLTFAAAAACGGLPDGLRTRTYAATIAPSALRPDTSFELTVTEPSFLENYRTFPIGVAGNYVAMWLGDFHGEPGLVEQPAPNAYLAFSGFAEASVGASPSAITASFDGSIDYCEQASAPGSRYLCNAGQAGANVQCLSRAHQVTLTRR